MTFHIQTEKVTMRSSLSCFAAILAMGILLMAPASGGAQCHSCSPPGCEEDEHHNRECAECIVGNYTQFHDACWAISCEGMQAQGVHKDDLFSVVSGYKSKSDNWL